jgi:hypothetical protein
MWCQQQQQQSAEQWHVVDEEKIRAAEALVARLRGGPHASIVQSYEQLTKAYLELAYYRLPNKGATERENSGVQEIPAKFLLRKLNSLPLPITTVDAPKTGQPFTTIQRFEPGYDLVGGITCPKRLKCLGSDGRFYLQVLRSFVFCRGFFDFVARCSFSKAVTTCARTRSCSSSSLL